MELGGKLPHYADLSKLPKRKYNFQEEPLCDEISNDLFLFQR